IVIERQTGASVSVSTGGDRDQRMAVVTGSRTQVDAASALIRDI
ncbi:hypothetical protein KIPB_016214, partial [Kipferlia bialata]